MKVSELVEILLLQNPEAETVIQILGVDFGFDILESEEKVILLTELPEPESPEDPRMFL